MAPFGLWVKKSGSAMDFIIRPLEERDLSECVELLRGHLAYPDSIFADLPKAWRRWLRDDVLVAAVGESTGNSKPAVLGFAMSVFVTDEWMAAARAAEEPYLAVRTICQEFHGKSPILRATAIQSGNEADGLNLLNLHYAEPHLPEEMRMKFRYAFGAAFIEYTRGYRIKEFIQEFWDEMPASYGSGWGQLLTDFAAYFGKRGQAPPPVGQRPRLVGLTRDNFLADATDLAAGVFVYTPARLRFTRAEQRMLRQAILGCTDLELARRLGLGLPTIKTRWRAIYDRVGQCAPELTPDADAAKSPATRGQEKRRHFLEYLRRHSEELRPGLWRTR